MFGDEDGARGPFPNPHYTWGSMETKNREAKQHAGGGDGGFTVAVLKPEGNSVSAPSIVLTWDNSPLTHLPLRSFSEDRVEMKLPPHRTPQRPKLRLLPHSAAGSQDGKWGVDEGGGKVRTRLE